MAKMDVTISHKEAIALIKEIDVDGNGTLAYDEFIQLVHSMEETNNDPSKAAVGFAGILRL